MAPSATASLPCMRTGDAGMSVLLSAVDDALAARHRPFVVIRSTGDGGDHPVALGFGYRLPPRRRALGLLHAVPAPHLDGEVRAMELAEQAGRAVLRARDDRVPQLVAVVHVLRAQLDADSAGLAELEVQRDLGSGCFAGLGLLLRSFHHRRHPSTIGRSMPLSWAFWTASGYPASAWRITPVQGTRSCLLYTSD